MVYHEIIKCLNILLPLNNFKIFLKHICFSPELLISCAQHLRTMCVKQCWEHLAQISALSIIGSTRGKNIPTHSWPLPASTSSTYSLTDYPNTLKPCLHHSQLFTKMFCFPFENTKKAENLVRHSKLYLSHFQKHIQDDSETALRVSLDFIIFPFFAPFCWFLLYQLFQDECKRTRS